MCYTRPRSVAHRSRPELEVKGQKVKSVLRLPSHIDEFRITFKENIAFLKKLVCSKLRSVAQKSMSQLDVMG